MAEVDRNLRITRACDASCCIMLILVKSLYVISEKHVACFALRQPDLFFYYTSRKMLLNHIYIHTHIPDI